MKCSKVQKVLTEDLSSAALSELRGHLEGCPECRSFLQDLEALQELKRSLPRRIQAPADFAGRMEGRLAMRANSRMFSRRALAFLSAALLLTALGWHRLASDSADEATQEVPRFSLGAKVEPLGGVDGTPEDQRIAGRTRSDYVEVIIQDSAGTPYLVRIPSRIHIRRNYGGRDALTLASY